jgi:ketosteroid isomerase-like protein
MAQENLEIVRQNYEQLSATGTPLFDSLDSEVEFEFAWMEGCGADAWVRAIALWKDTFDSWEIELRELVEAGPDQVVAIVRDRARPKGSTARIDNEFAHLWTLLDGRVVRFEAFLTKADALKAAGESE